MTSTRTIRSKTAAAALAIAGAGLALALAFGFGTHTEAQQVQPHPSVQSGGGETYAIDSVHSSLMFKIKHMDVANFYGRFNDLAGTYTLDPANLAISSFDLQVDAASVDTKSSKRDDHLRSPDFFNVTEYPSIAFKSKKVEKAGDNALKVTGDLTLHGVTKPVTVDMTITPGRQTPQGVKSGFETTFTIKRTDFGMDTYVANGALGDEVTITVAGEGAKK